MLKLNKFRYLLFSLFGLFISTSTAYAISPSILGNTAVLAPPVYTKVHAPEIGSKLYVNTNIVGNVVIVREIRVDGSLGPKYGFEVKPLNENWAEIEFENPITSFNELIVVGSSGNIQISKSKTGEDINLYKNGTSSGKFEIRFGTANETVYFPDSNIQDIESIDVGIVDKNGEKVNGEAIIATDRYLVLQFRGIKPEFIENGQVRLVLRFRSKSLLADIDSWGYDFDVAKNEGTKKHLTSNVYGLKPGNKVRVYFETSEGQTIEPVAEVFTVRELNDGKIFAIIEDNNSPVKLDLVLEK